MSQSSPSGQAGRGSELGAAVLGALLGGLLGSGVVVLVTLVLKAGMDFVSGLGTGLIILLPLVGLAVAVLIFNAFCTETTVALKGRLAAYRAFPREVARADISNDVVESAGKEERFPWRLAPIRALAILATVGTGGAMGTEAPAAYLGVAAGVWLGDRGQRWRRLLRPAALAGGAAGVSALMGIALVGTAFMLELGRRKRAPLDVPRVTAALIGGFIGWGINKGFGLDLIRLVVPKVPPGTLLQAAITALFIGAASGAIGAAAGQAVFYAKKWRAPALVRFALGGATLAATALLLAHIAVPSAASGPGGGAILWAESVEALPLTLLAVCLLRALATTATVAAGGCGGVFVPFLAVGDLAGRVFAPGLGVGNDLAGAAGAAGGIAGGYRLPFTAVAMVLGVGGPPRATLTCLATIVVAAFAGGAVETLLETLKGLARAGRRAPVH